MANEKPKRGETNDDGMVYWDTLSGRGQRWITPEKYKQWSEKKASRMKKYNAAEERKIACRINMKKFLIRNPLAQRGYDKKQRLKNREAIDERRRRWAAKNPEKTKAAAARSRSTLEKRRAIYKKTLSNPLAKLRITIRGRTLKAIKNKGWSKKSKACEYLGCDWPCAKQHLENQFKPGMSWDNHGFLGWHIDHIIPLASAKTADELIPLLHYTNLQPLWAMENIKKWAKMPDSYSKAP
jgi:hypothetical protein